MEKVKPFIVMDILKEAKTLDGVVHLEIGEPDLDPPPSAIKALEEAIKYRRYFYTPSLGIHELREKIAEHYYKKYGVDISPERVVITTGTSGAFLVSYSVLLNEGERIAIADPSYPCYKNFAYLLDIQPVLVPVDEKTGYQITQDMLKEQKDIRAVHVSSPSNPTGSLYDEKNLKELTSYCDERGLYLISDEIYHGLVYEKKERTALEFSDRAIVISGFSKWFCMPGFRIGWMVLPQELIRKSEIVIQNLFISAPTLSQYAALGAFDYEHLEKVREVFRKRRDTVYEQLKDTFDILSKPDGAFYYWLDVSKFTDDSYSLSMELLRKAKVAVTPGIDFGNNKTDRFIRIAYTREEEALREGLNRLKAYLMK